jgi:REP element-mobilizing transposase RayT
VGQDPRKIPAAFLDSFIVMPNHIHGIIFIDKELKIVGATLAVARGRAGASPAPTLGNIVGAYKSLCVNRWLKYIKDNGLDIRGVFWQRNYYEHIIRDENELNMIREYIVFNPFKWSSDADNPNHVYDAEYTKRWKWLER